VTKPFVECYFKEGTVSDRYHERGQFRDFLINQENQLNSYGWVDKKAGVAHIPIERAMELTVQRGLSVCPQDCTDANTTTASKAPAQKPAAPKQ
jgi:hypothetical protein